jgi:cell division protein FtsI (penicillin-binding protein 3)
MLANKGVQVRPRLVKAIRDKVQPVQVVGQLVKPEVAELTIRTMERVFHDEEGTGKNLVIEGYRLAGKSGTPQRVNPETGTLKGGGYIPSFIGLVPARDPKVVILVMIENPKSQEYLGAQVAGPVFREIAQSVIRYYKLPATEPVTASAKKKSS